MSIKFDESSKTYSVTFSRRPPDGGAPIGLKRKGIKTQAEAKRVLNELIVLVNDKAKKTKIPTWKEHLESYFVSLETSGITLNTRFNREKLLLLHTPLWNCKSLDEITTEDIHRLLNERFKENKESHRKFFLKCVRSVFQFAVEKNLINRNPTPILKFKIKSKIKSVLIESQIVALLRKAQDQNWPWYPHYSVAVFTGLRNGELYALRWSQVDLEKRLILVNCSWNSRDGFKSTKSGDDRVVEIPNVLLPLLRDLKLMSADSEFVLPRLGRWDRGEQAYDLRLFLRSLNLPEIRFHDLRASWATILLSKGVAAGTVMAMGGWADMNTMMIYVRKAGIDIKNSTDVLDGLNTHGINQGKLIAIGKSF